MLKIKDSVDLKELEKFGFEDYTSQYYGTESVYVKDIYEDEKKIALYEINIEDRLIIIDVYEGINTTISNTLYDLIQEELVEKVDK